MSTVSLNPTPTSPSLTPGGDSTKFLSLLSTDPNPGPGTATSQSQAGSCGSYTAPPATPSGPFNLGDASTWPAVGGALPSGYAWAANGIPYDINNPPGNARALRQRLNQYRHPRRAC